MLRGRVLADGLVARLDGVDKVLLSDTLLDVRGEERVVLILVLFFELLHVLCEVGSKDLGRVLLSIIVDLAILIRVAREELLVVRDVEPTVNRTLQGAKNAAPLRGALDAHVQEAAERAHARRAILILIKRVHKVLAAIILIRRRRHLTRDLGRTLVQVGQRRLGAVDIDRHLAQQTTRAQQASRVRGRVVLEADAEPVARQL
mmetsp:Transcript_125854/g.305757  ORF Transcript_125854/g.305757 Transcript_125854/m.305757 type:complete len:203 (+) Transcript_125854:400-1008(+)